MAPAKVKICLEDSCRNVQTTKGYCRLHYLKNWRAVRSQAQKKAADRLNRYVEGICKKYPDRFLEVIRRDLSTDNRRQADDVISHDEVDEILHDLGYADDDNLDKLIKQIKVDREF